MSGVLLIVGALISLGASPKGVVQSNAAEVNRLVLAKYGDCVVRRHHLLAAREILEHGGSGGFEAVNPKLLRADCLSVSSGSTEIYSFRGDTYRYLLADALVRKDLAGEPVPDVAGVPMLKRRQPFFPEPGAVNIHTGRKLTEEELAEAQKDFELHNAFYLLSVFGECVVRANPTAARSLLLTRPGSEDERARMTAMDPELSSCIPKGQTLSFQKHTLRGTIAINYYRLAMAARGGGGAYA